VRKRKIAFIGSKSFPSQAGVDRVVEAIARCLAEKGEYEITIFVDKDKYDHIQIPDNIELIPFIPFGGKYFRAFSQFIQSGVYAILKGDYDLIHLHNLEAAFLLPLLKLRYPVVSTSHIVTHRRKDQWGKIPRMIIRAMEYPFIYLSNQITSVSLHDTEYYNNRHKKQVKWIPNGVTFKSELKKEYIDDILKKYDLEYNRYILFVAGRIIPTKGCHLLLQAAKNIETTNPFPIVILGDMSRDIKYGERLKEIAQKNTYFIPFIESKSEVEALIEASKLLVFPSLVEGMSMVLLEAVTQKSKIIVSDIPENKSVLEDKALYFESENIGDLGEKILWALANYHEMEKLSLDAYRYVFQNYSWETIVNQYENCYNDI
jgi:glycosyltransferase involved in cell wall biosynthesis